MRRILSEILESISKNLLEEAIGQYDKWEYDDKIFYIPVLSGTNGPAASVDEIVAASNYVLEPGERSRISTEISKDISAGVALDEAKRRALNRMSERRGVKQQHPVPIPGDNDDNTLTGVPLPATPDELMAMPVEQWSNHDVGVVHKEAIRTGYDTPKGREMAQKVKSWYGHHVEKQTKGPSATGAAPSSGGGPVHVDAYSRTQDGKSLSVRSHTRSLPR